MKAFNVLLSVLCASVCLCACSGVIRDYDGFDAGAHDYIWSGKSEGEGPGSGPGQGQGERSRAGVLTAGEWNDLDHWAFWGGLMNMQDTVLQGQRDSTYLKYCPYWGFHTQNRVAVRVETAGGEAVAGAEVVLLRDGKEEWSSITDVFGRADCWAALYENADTPDSTLVISIDGVEQTGHPVVTRWGCDSVSLNIYETSGQNAVAGADIAFIVDATGSMGDEITFLKADLLDIFRKVDSCVSITIRTAALFYRDEGDDYLTRESGFTGNVSTTAEFVRKQNASGGGDYPEAVHTALQNTLQNLQWSETARARIAFMLLDAPAHHTKQIVGDLQKSVKDFAAHGIKLIPVAASGVDKGTEFMLRFFSIATGGTYVFLTDDSGVGGEHIKASVGQYEVENLNELIVRLIVKYADGRQ